MSAPRIVVVGDVMLDVTERYRTERPSPEDGSPVLRLRSRRVSPGGAANAARIAAGLGAEVKVFGVVGFERATDRLCAKLLASGVRCRLFHAPDRPTTVKRRIIADHSSAFRIDRESREPIPDEVAEHLTERAVLSLSSASALLLSDYGKGTLTPAVLSALIGEARRLGIPVVCDPKGPDATRYAGATALTPNAAESAELPGVAELLGLVGVVLAKDGPGGMTLHQAGHEPRHWPAEARRVRSVVGAGDAVAAALAVALGKGEGIEPAVSFASRVAARLVEGRPLNIRAGGANISL
jgi:D-beta-D-heptose 7-phosphate kinase/D-beta-D-heptose 1-phosphate adenosyltransferase